MFLLCTHEAVVNWFLNLMAIRIGPQIREPC